MCKFALILVRDYIRENKVPVKIVMAVHDQIDTIVHKDYAEEWCKELDRLMFESTLPTIPSGLLKADTNISNVWEK
jgi:DNA polymerase I-like protein with 3'-5' exonuclease and polymerase domains